MHDPSQRRVRTLVVDDENSVRVLLQTVLRRAGHEVTVVETAAEGLAELRRQDFHLVITDKNLPDVSGLEFYKQARALRPELKGILITGYPSPEAEAAANALGVYAYVIKPFQVSDVLALCEGAIKLTGSVEPERGT